MGLVIGEEAPSNIAPVAFQKPMIKVLFKIALSEALSLTANPEERRLLINQRDGRAIVYNDNYCSRATVDFSGEQEEIMGFKKRSKMDFFQKWDDDDF